jgi:hypothetical protein
MKTAFICSAAKSAKTNARPLLLPRKTQITYSKSLNKAKEHCGVTGSAFLCSQHFALGSSELIVCIKGCNLHFPNDQGGFLLTESQGQAMLIV